MPHFPPALHTVLFMFAITVMLVFADRNNISIASVCLSLPLDPHAEGKHLRHTASRTKEEANDTIYDAFKNLTKRKKFSPCTSTKE